MFGRLHMYTVTISEPASGEVLAKGKVRAKRIVQARDMAMEAFEAQSERTLVGLRINVSRGVES